MEKNGSEALLPKPQEKKPPWCRFIAATFLLCQISGGVTGGLPVYINMFAAAGMFGGSMCGVAPGNGNHSEVRPPVFCDTSTLKVSTICLGATTASLMGFPFLGVSLDRLGGRTMATGSALITTASFFVVRAALHQSLHDPSADSGTQALFALGLSVWACASYICLYSSLAFLWHFDGRQGMLLNMVNGAPICQAIFALLMQYLIDNNGLDLETLLFWYGLLNVIGSALLCPLMPSKAEADAKLVEALGPRAAAKHSEEQLSLCRGFRLALAVFGMHKMDFFVMFIVLSLLSSVPTVNAGFSPLLGKAIFLTSDASTNLASQAVVLGVISSFFSPFWGYLTDRWGISFLLVFNMLSYCVLAITVSIPNYAVQGVGQFLMMTSMIMGPTFFQTWLLGYAPPKMYGTMLGMSYFLMTFGMLAIVAIATSFSASLPPGPDAFIIPIRSCCGVTVAVTCLYILYLRRWPPPTTPPLGDDEAEDEAAPPEFCWLCMEPRTAEAAAENVFCLACQFYGPSDEPQGKPQENQAPFCSWHVLPSGRVVRIARRKDRKRLGGAPRKAIKPEAGRTQVNSNAPELCPSCGATFQHEARFCAFCGLRRPDAEQEEEGFFW